MCESDSREHPIRVFGLVELLRAATRHEILESGTIELANLNPTLEL
jgi:hypothetical protein